MPGAAIEVRDVRKTLFDRGRGESEVLRGISFACEGREVVGLLGPNGAGKTTTLRLLAGLLRPTSGEVRVDGLDPVAEPIAARMRIGYITGSTRLYGRLTPLETLRFFGELHEMSGDQIERRSAELMETFDLRSFRDSPCSRLSTGQKQRVNLARAIMHSPPVLLLDEPMTSLDILTSRTVLDYARQARDEGRCVLFSTHNIAEAELLCDRILVMHLGRILAFDRLENLLAATGQASLSRALLALIERHEPATV
jgi:sodium transport system ATP-binding protein